MVPPEPDEYEITLFGPGFGECVLIHTGNDEWIVVDSCVDPSDPRGEPVALDYLSELGIDPTIAIKMIVASHWHDDHVRGISKIVERCPAAQFTCSAAINSINFLSLVAATHGLTSKIPSGASEFLKIVELRVKERHRRPTTYAVANTLIWRNDAGTAMVTALSPSSASFEAALTDISRLVDEISVSRRLVPVHSENKSTVAVWLDLAGNRILLGGDLEAPADNRIGWRGILASTLRPNGKAQVYKVAHHGSRNAHLDEIWHGLLEDQNISLIAPWRNGSHRLPSDEQLTR